MLIIIKICFIDSLLVGSLPSEPCLTRAPSFRVRGGVSFDVSDHKLGIMMSSFNQKRSKMDGTGAWHLSKLAQLLSLSQIYTTK